MLTLVVSTSVGDVGLVLRSKIALGIELLQLVVELTLKIHLFFRYDCRLGRDHRGWRLMSISCNVDVNGAARAIKAVSAILPCQHSRIACVEIKHLASTIAKITTCLVFKFTIHNSTLSATHSEPATLPSAAAISSRSHSRPMTYSTVHTDKLIVFEPPQPTTKASCGMRPFFGLSA